MKFDDIEINILFKNLSHLVISWLEQIRSQFLFVFMSPSHNIPEHCSNAHLGNPHPWPRLRSQHTRMYSTCKMTSHVATWRHTWSTRGLGSRILRNPRLSSVHWCDAWTPWLALCVLGGSSTDIFVDRSPSPNSLLQFEFSLRTIRWPVGSTCFR